MQQDRNDKSQSGPLLVTAALIVRTVADKSQVLIARRKLSSSLEAGKWEFPGGKVEPLEHPEVTVVREIREELDLEIRVDRLFDVASHVYESDNGPLHIVLLCYICRLADPALSEFRPLDVEDAKWCAVDELERYDYAEADVAVVQKFISNFR